MKIAIVGLGYVGLPLALQFAKNRQQVIGLDIDPEKVSALNRGQTYIKHIDAAEIKKQVKGGHFSASSDFSKIRDAQAVIICVPTPLNKNREPDISYILNTGEAMAPHLQRGTLVVLESTTYPGTTDEDLRAVLEKGSGLKAGTDFHLAFSPEREDPGNPSSRVAHIPKVIGGFTPQCLAKAKAVYGIALENLVPVSSCRAAESTKLLENIFRAVNIALVNELKVVYAAMGIDVWEVIDAAKTKPFGFMPFYPGPGLGGHCIPIDPFYLTWKSREYGQNTKFIELAGEVNTSMPKYVVSRVMEALNDRSKALKGSRILLLGLAYKANVDDMRESPTFVLMDLLTQGGAKVAYHDPYIPIIRPTREHSHWTGMKSVRWGKKTVSSFDVVLVSTAHKSVDYRKLAQWAPLIVDTRNAMAGIKTKPKQVWKSLMADSSAIESIDWFVAHTRPRCEKKVVQYCGDMGVATTLPCYHSVRKYRGKTVTFEKPLFPGYVFLQAQRKQRGKIYQSDYVANLLDVPDPTVLEQQLADILRALDTGLEIVLAPEIGKGMRVKIKNGTLAGLEGWVEERYGFDTVLLRLDFIGQAAAVKLNAADLEPI